MKADNSFHCSVVQASAWRVGVHCFAKDRFKVRASVAWLEPKHLAACEST
jgi:hypothetical protein